MFESNVFKKIYKCKRCWFCVLLMNASVDISAPCARILTNALIGKHDTLSYRTTELSVNHNEMIIHKQ